MLKMTCDLRLSESLWLLMFSFYENVLSFTMIANRRRFRQTDESNAGGLTLRETETKCF